jgi:outer membrane protein assembly factor BamB
VAATAVAAAALALWSLAVVRQALGGLEQAREPGRDRDAVRFERKRLDPPRGEGVRLFQATRAARAVERFKDSYFTATDGGLVELSPSGRVARRFSVLDGLGESDLTSLAAYAGRLYIGTRGNGLLAFDGEHFEKYWWPDRDSRSITALSVDQGKLLVGTFSGGLLEFDGRGFREVRAGEARARLDAVTFVARCGPRLYFGTFNQGLWVSEGGRWAHFTSADGLASERVLGVVESGGEALAACDFGLSEAQADRLVLGAGADARRAWRTSATAPSLSSAVAFAGRVVLSKDDGEVATLAAPRPGAPGIKAEEITWAGPGAPQTGARLAALDGRLWLLGSRGVWRSAGESSEGGAGRESKQISFAAFGVEESAQSPTDNLISALALDAAGNLWAGSFRNGVDVFAPSGVREAHLESDELREVNALVPDEHGGVFAATSRGVVRLDSTLRAERLDTPEAPAGNSVMHVALSRKPGEAAPLKTSDSASQELSESASQKSSPAAAPRAGSHAAAGELIAATSRGLSLYAPGGVRALTTVQGLPSNSVYALWPEAGRVYAGTLGGLAEISSGRVVRVFKDSNSALACNWVTAVRGAGGRLFVGTYGGGVYELLPSGDLRSFAQETGKAFVNPNAMWGDAERLYVGTLDGALVFDLRSQKWTRVRDELPTATVLSVTGGEGRVYFGTTGGLARFDESFFNPAD